MAPRDRSSADQAGKEAPGKSAARKYLRWVSAGGERAELSKASERALSWKGAASLTNTVSLRQSYLPQLSKARLAR